jgi:hypothetical protein
MERAMGTTLKQGAVLTDILAAVPASYEFMERVLENMGAYKKAHGSAYVTITLTGEGAVPPYRVAPAPPSEFSKVFDGLTHTPIEDHRLRELRDNDWSDASMGYEELLARFIRSRGRSRPIQNPRRGKRWNWL